jgi:hypothetical protein
VEKGGPQHALDGIIVNTTIEGHAAALIVSATATVASVKSVFTAAVVGATTAANWLHLMALVLLLVTTAAALSNPGCFVVGIEACQQGAGCRWHCRAFRSAPA